MNFIPFLLAIVPTFVLMWLVGAFRTGSSRCLPIWVGMLSGALVSVPIWFVETVIEDGGAKLSNLYERTFVQQVLGAAVSEELFMFVAFIGTYVLFRGGRVRTQGDIVAIAVAAAIGFTTVENVFAVVAAPSPMSVGLSRLLSIVAGHASLQLVMGYFAAGVLLRRQHRLRNAILMFAIPILIHGWGDFTEAIFQAVDPDSDESKMYFSYWIFGVFAYIVAAVMVLFQLQNPGDDSGTSDSGGQESEHEFPDLQGDRGSSSGSDDFRVAAE